MSGELVRLRRDHYVRPGSARDADAAVTLGGRLTCTSLFAELGIFAVKDGRLHVRVEPNAARLRAHPGTTAGANTRGTAPRVHWGVRHGSTASRDRVDLSDAIIDLVRCQPPRLVVATLDNLLHRGALAPEELEEVFALLPSRYRPILALVDGRAESGIESLVRLMLRAMGGRLELQATIDTVGRVDLIVNGWLIVECDSREFHEGWDQQRRDRRRDLAAAALGYTTIRLLAEDVLYRPDDVHAALRAVLRSPSRRRVARR
jgi:very-short-patch-repair endonuclease